MTARVVESRVFSQSRSRFFKIAAVGVGSRSQVFKTAGVGASYIIVQSIFSSIFLSVITH